MDLRDVWISVLWAVVASTVISADPLDLDPYVTFKYFINNTVALESRSNQDNLRSVCDPKGPWLLVVPGWTDSCSAQTPWLPPIIEKFSEFRGGCICCMDFYPLASDPSILGYVNLTTHFDGLSDVLYRRLLQFERQGFVAAHGYMFAMSFGSRLAFDAGLRFGGRLGGIDACDPAGPLFYPNPVFQLRGRVRDAARNVQCIHTSIDEGTFERDCHQDWCMGNCGISQVSAGIQTQPQIGPALPNDCPIYVPYSRLNHGTCPVFYASAFENRFEAVDNPCCPVSERDARPIPGNYRMGYMQKNKGSVRDKTLFALTAKKSPYNVL